MRKKFFIPFIVLFLSANSLGQSQQSLDKLRADGYQALYNLDYETARQRFRQMIELAPEHPAGAQCYAASLWIQQLNESWELKATLYSEKSYARDNTKLDSKRVQEFRQWIRLSKQLSKNRLLKDSRDQEALYFLGAAEGLESAFAAAVERKFMAALRTGSDSVDHHRALLKLAPDFRDAELTIGLQNYIIGSLPLPLKILVGSMGVRGSRKRGLEILERVAKEGVWARDVARVLLVDLYKREKRWIDAIQVSRELAEKYPANYLFKLQLADALTAKILASPQRQPTEELLRVFNSLLQVTKDVSVLDLIHFRFGETLLLLGEIPRALIEFQIVVSRASAEPVLKALSRLRLAQCLDVVGKREEALAMYRVVLTTEEGTHFENEVRRGLKEPYRPHNQSPK